MSKIVVFGYIDKDFIKDLLNIADAIYLSTNDNLNIEGNIKIEPYNNNKNKLFNNCKKYILDKYNTLDNWYGLYIPQNSIFISNTKFKNLTHDGYKILEKDSIYDNYEVRLLKLSKDWICKGRTNEYWTLKDTDISIYKDCYYENKNIIDYELLKLDLQDESNNERYNFYMAEYLEKDNVDKAVEYYNKCIKSKSSSKDYKYLSYYRLGNIYNNKDWNEAFKNYSIAYTISDGERIEPYLKIAEHYYDKDNYLSFKYALIASKNGYPKNNTLYIERDAYNYLVDKLLSIRAFYEDKKDLSLYHTNLLMIKKDVPYSIVSNAFNNLQYHSDRVKIPLVFDKKITFELPKHYHICNPSIIKINEGFIVNFKSVHYIVEGKNYILQGIENNDWNKKLDKNYLVNFDKEFNIKNINLLNHEDTYTLQESRGHHRFNHIEDIRLFEFNNEIYFTSTYMNDVYLNTPKRIALYKINNQSKIIHLKDFDTFGNIEKNWLPFVSGGKINLMYNHSKILELDDAYNPIMKIDNFHGNEENKFELSRLRGGSGPLKLLDGNNLVIFHEVYFKNDLRHYMHRFALYNKDFNLIRLSKIFNFRNERIEFCSGMCENNDKDGVILTYGVMDVEAYICEVKYEEIQKLFI